MDPLAPVPDPKSRHIAADVRLLARLEGACAVLQTVLEAGVQALREEMAATRERLDADTSRPVPPIPSQAAPPAQTPSTPAQTSPAPKGRRLRTFRPRVYARPMTMLAFRAANLIPDAARAANALAHRLIDQGVDVAQEVYQRRLAELTRQALHELGIDLNNPARGGEIVVARALQRIDELVQEAHRRILSTMPSHRREVLTAPLSPQGP